MSKDSVLTLDGLSVQFGGLRAVDNLDLSIEEGQFAGLIGPNGSGKTTTFNAITGVVPVSGGDIHFMGTSLPGLPPNKIANLGISRTFQSIRLFPRLTVKANVALAVHRIPSYSPWEAFLRTRKVVEADRRVDEEAGRFLDEMGLSQYAGREARTLPYGLQRKLEICRALATKPKLLLLDEPAAGMNDQECNQLGELLLKIHKDHKLTILLVEHHMSLVSQTCERITAIDLGRKIAEGTTGEVQSDPHVVSAYLGERRKPGA